MLQAANFAEIIKAAQLSKDDTFNEIRIRLLNRFGTAISLDGATASWTGTLDRKEVIVERSAQVYTAGQVGFKLPANAGLKPGNLYIQIEITTADGKKEKYPANGDLFIRIT